MRVALTGKQLVPNSLQCAIFGGRNEAGVSALGRIEHHGYNQPTKRQRTTGRIRTPGIISPTRRTD